MKIGEKTNCVFCGGILGTKFVEGRLRKFCNACKEVLYENPVPAACTIVIDDEDRVLLVKRSVEPGIGKWCLPGGFIELDEAPPAAALRELREETGLDGKIELLLGVTSNPNPFYGAVIIICYLVKNFSGIPSAGDDAVDVAFFDSDNLPEIAFRAHQIFIRNFYSTFCPVT
jgi:ADP-ribose pyrophosphatase YjhB (NUDIX family)